MGFTYELFDKTLDQLDAYWERFSLDTVELVISANRRVFFVSGFLYCGRDGVVFSHYSPKGPPPARTRRGKVCEPVAALPFDAIDCIEFSPLQPAKTDEKKHVGFHPLSSAERSKYKEEAEADKG